LPAETVLRCRLLQVAQLVPPLHRREWLRPTAGPAGLGPPQRLPSTALTSWNIVPLALAWESRGEAAAVAKEAGAFRCAAREQLRSERSEHGGARAAGPGGHVGRDRNNEYSRRRGNKHKSRWRVTSHQSFTKHTDPSQKRGREPKSRLATLAPDLRARRGSRSRPRRALLLGASRSSDASE
jgi:hypothetical protein